ncbi:PSP1 domain-containing protein [Streptococcus caprae]|uniref:Stage 0 sporulation family protein n=1 Tax=Streptococcus caprae TaxID=1640501 RepID=A0ABV8CSS4_9STRE
MTRVLGVRYEEQGDLTYVLPDQSYEIDEFVVIETEKGPRLAQVCLASREVDEAKLPLQMARVKGPASDRDLQIYHDNILAAQAGFDWVKGQIAEHGLPMKLIDLVYALDRSHVYISFAAEGRVDFRSLLKDLAQHFKARIELRQLNQREEAKVYGGLGPCGRALCCSTFLGEFPPVSIKMVRNQNLSLASNKNLGACGKLMCCLSFEDEVYREAREKFPDVGTTVVTKDGQGVVTGLDILGHTLTIRLDEKPVSLRYELEEVTVYG